MLTLVATVSLPGLRLPLPNPTHSMLLQAGIADDGRPILVPMNMRIRGALFVDPGAHERSAEVTFLYDESARSIIAGHLEFGIWYGTAVGTLRVVALRED